jgi:hypothetical protein
MSRPNLQDTSLHDRWLGQQLEDPEFRSAHERELDELATDDADPASEDPD